MRKEFELTHDQLERLLNASKPVPYMVMDGLWFDFKEKKC